MLATAGGFGDNFESVIAGGRCVSALILLPLSSGVGF